MAYATEDTLHSIGEVVNNPQIVQAVKRLVESNDALQKEIEEVHREQIEAWTEKIIRNTEEKNGVLKIVMQMPRTGDFVKNLAYNLRNRKKNLVFVVGSDVEGKVSLIVALGDDIVAKGVDAGAVVREAAKAINGGGGGQKFFATAGGKRPEGLQQAIGCAESLIMEALK